MPPLHRQTMTNDNDSRGWLATLRVTKHAQADADCDHNVVQGVWCGGLAIANCTPLETSYKRRQVTLDIHRMLQVCLGSQPSCKQIELATTWSPGWLPLTTDRYHMATGWKRPPPQAELAHKNLDVLICWATCHPISGQLLAAVVVLEPHLSAPSLRLPA